MNRKLATAGAAIVLGFSACLAYFVTRPSATIDQLREAIVKQDRTTLERLVDFPTFRESVKTKLRQELSSSAVATGNPIAAIGAVLVEKVLEPVVDAVVSPSGIAALLAGSRMLEASKDPRPVDASTTSFLFVGSWDGPSRYIVAISNNGNHTATLVLHRHSLFEWRLGELR